MLLVLLVGAYFFTENFDQIRGDLGNWSGRKLTAAQERLTARRATLRTNARKGFRPWVGRAPARAALAVADAAWGFGRSVRVGTGRAVERAKAKRDEIQAAKSAVADPDPVSVSTPDSAADSKPVEGQTDSDPSPDSPAVQDRIDAPDPGEAGHRDPTRDLWPKEPTTGQGPASDGPPKLRIVSPSTTPEAIPAPGPINLKEPSMAETQNVEQAKAILEELRAAAVAELEDKEADVQRARQNAATAEGLAIFADWAEAPEPYRLAMQGAMEPPLLAEKAAVDAKVAAEKSVTAIDLALAENAKQMQVAEVMAAAGGGLKREAYGS